MPLRKFTRLDVIPADNGYFIQAMYINADGQIVMVIEFRRTVIRCDLEGICESHSGKHIFVGRAETHVARFVVVSQ